MVNIVVVVCQFWLFVVCWLLLCVCVWCGLIVCLTKSLMCFFVYGMWHVLFHVYLFCFSLGCGGRIVCYSGLFIVE